MLTLRAVLFGILGLLAATSAEAQQATAPSPATTTALSGQSVTVGPRSQNPTPLFFIGDLGVGVWTRVPPPYDATANRSAADNPLP